MTIPLDPTLMSPTERLREIAILLEIGCRRLSLSRKKELEVAAEEAPSCPAVAGEPNAEARKEAM